VGFLARVKPEMLIGYRRDEAMEATTGALTPPCTEISSARDVAAGGGLTARSSQSLTLLVALLVVLASPGLARAHRLIGAYRVLSDRRVQVQSFFSSGDPPRDGTVKVMRPDKTTLAEGILDEKGLFVFHFDQAEDLKVFIEVAAGTTTEHRAEFTIPAKDLSLSEGEWTSTPETAPNRLDEKTPFVIPEEWWIVQLKDTVIGVGFLLAIAAFVLSFRNARRLRALTKALERRDVSPGELPAQRSLPADRDRSLTE
jgi:nickel transport protein